MKTVIAALFGVLTMVAAAMSDEDIIASTLWMEARGEGEVGVRAVASVINNRAMKSGKTAAFECLRPLQFSCWNGKKPTALPIGANGKMWDVCRTVAKEMVSKTFKTKMTATHYYNPSLCNPSWGRKMKDVVVIGRHRFGRC